MDKQELKCCWCWWARINKDVELICTNHSQTRYGTKVTDDESCYLFVDVNKL